jgi:hypothetical protein
MATDEKAWEVREHGPLVQLAENLWWVSGSLPGMTLRRTMTVVRLADGALLLHSPIAMDADGMREIEALGRPAWLVVPNAGHRLDAPRYKARYPEIRVIAPPGARAGIEEKVPVDLLTTEAALPADTVRFEALHGVADTEAAMLVRSADGTTVVLNDVMFNMDPKADWLGWIITSLLGSAPGPRVSRFAKWMFVKDKAALRADFERFAALPDLVRVIVSHEKVARGPDAAEALRKAATYL